MIILSSRPVSFQVRTVCIILLSSHRISINPSSVGPGVTFWLSLPFSYYDLSILTLCLSVVLFATIHAGIIATKSANDCQRDKLFMEVKKVLNPYAHAVKGTVSSTCGCMHKRVKLKLMLFCLCCTAINTHNLYWLKRNPCEILCTLIALLLFYFKRCVHFVVHCTLGVGTLNFAADVVSISELASDFVASGFTWTRYVCHFCIYSTMYYSLCVSDF